MPAQTLTQYLLDVATDTSHGDCAKILASVGVSVKLTAAAISRGPLVAEPGAPEQRASGREMIRQVRRLATRTLLERTEPLAPLGAVSVAGTRAIATRNPGGRYLLLSEALHGPRNLIDNLSVGATFSVLAREAEGTARPEEFLQAGRRQVCAGIAVYGPRTMLVLTTGDGVDGFTLDREVGNFVLTHPNIAIPAEGRQFTVNAGEASRWPAPVKRYVEECVLGSDGPRGHDFTMRWNASAVVGAYRVLNGGGLFLVPDTGPSGWLAPLLHTAAPLAFLSEQAGGAASTGTGSVLDVLPDALDTRVPFFFGSRAEVARIEDYHADSASDGDREFTHPLFHQRSLFID